MYNYNNILNFITTVVAVGHKGESDVDITMIMVMSLDGKISNEYAQIHEWASAEDQAHLKSILKQYDAAIMGRKSYFCQDFPCEMYVLTHNEQLLHQQDDSHVFYVTGDVRTVCKEMAKKGIKKAALLGGSHTNYLFLKNKLVTDIYITIEGKVFGTGQSLVIPRPLDCELVLDSVEKLNQRGTLLLHYIVER